MDDTTKQIIGSLQHRRQSLQMPLEVLAQRADLGWATVQRALGGGSNVRLDTLKAIADGLEVKLDIRMSPLASPRQIQEREARRKAKTLAGMAQANAGLEGQAVGEDVLKDVESSLVHELMAGSKKRLWAT